ncbi:DUF7260 family protein [Halomarina oriensis]|uniref:DUF7260 domain-containing protein n=1 Tax=Halomarina oriensis TaxID=671145 RepID=A0A6B0GFW0_9EURY|nr:hypothetical protein [Halomarina oriensis]MWG33816.1 hypothetical protein [Halomarina oriensis]
MHTHTLAPIDTALERVATERRALDTERAAYETFANRVAPLDVAVPAHQSTASQTLPSAVGVDRRPCGTDPIREAFRDTVMSVPHYDADYGESLLAHASGELSPELARGLQSDAPPPGFKRTLLDEVEDAIKRRRSLLDHLVTEADSLAAARSALRDVVAGLDSVWGRREGGASAGPTPDKLTEQCRAVIEDRQSLVQNRLFSSIHDGHDFCTYLYGDVDGWTYPVLSVAASLRRDIDALDSSL